MEYIKFKFDTKKLKLKESVIRIYPIVCWHLGSLQSDGKFIHEVIKKVKGDPNARVVYLGDGGDCVTRLSKGDIFEQTLSPQGQHDRLVEILEPIKEKLLFGIRGNHGHRVFKETGLSFDKTLCHRLGIPYMGAACFANFVVNRSSYDAYFHHGTQSGVSAQSKVNSAEKFTKFIDADAIFTAHSHFCTEIHPSSLLSTDNSACKVKTKLRHQYMCGSAYDSRTGYAQDKGYAPLLPGHIIVGLDGRIVEGKAVKKQHYERMISDGQHEIVEP